MSLDGEKKKITRAVDGVAGDMLDINRRIFDKPELCYQEKFARQALADYLSSNGFSVTTPAGWPPTSFIARHGKAKTPSVAILAEYDALPQIGHACGHSMIAAAGCGAATAIVKAAPGHAGSLLVIGTPAEEGGGGKIKMLAKGAFKGVDAAIMIHPSNKTRAVARMYAISHLTFEFRGKAAHAAAFPDKGVNALDAGVLFYNAVSALRQQLKAEARVHGIFTHGGDAPNIIPERVEMKFYVRALDYGYFREVERKVVECAHGSARAAGCKLKITKGEAEYAPFYPSYPMGRIFRENMKTLGIAEDSFSETEEIGSSDIGNLSQVLPTLHPEFRVGDKGEVNHSRDFLTAVVSKNGAAAMIAMTKAMALTVYDLLAKPALMAEVKKEFMAATRKGSGRR
jgi:amidohydrolase